MTEPGAAVATCHGVEVPAAPHLGPRMIEAMRDGVYEGPEIAGALGAIRPGERVLELGAGSGLVGAIVARNCGVEAVLSFEANPGLIPHIETLYARNGLSGRISVRHAVVLAQPDAPEAAEFFVRGNFLGSGMTIVKGQRKAQKVSVPVVRYAELRESFPHQVIVMDIEGAELDFLAHADLSGVRAVVAELHRHIYGREGVRACRAAFTAAGLNPVPELSAGGVGVWRRDG